ncbi:pyridoxal phosphate-dependent aminotransferase [Candidatus Bipolaricaulota bacterium]|nr:pyridoxal phosphate-dependent aminotransferase [Candidatus Bipolaricaulota bacterium]
MNKKFIAQRMERIAPSGIREYFRLAKSVEKEGQDQIYLAIGRPDFDTPGHIKKAANTALDEGFVHYTDNRGIAELRKKIVKKLKNDNGLEIDPDTELIVTIGANEALASSMTALLDPGDEVIVSDPCFPYYLAQIQLPGGVPVKVPRKFENNLLLDPKEVKDKITSSTKAILVNSPHNPTGTVLDREVLESLAKIAKEEDLIVISDEVYEKIIYEGAKHHSIATFPGMAERTLTVNAFSKAYSMTGWRMGYLAGPEFIVGQALKIHQNTIASACSFGQKGAVAALNNDLSTKSVEEMVEQFSDRRKLVLDRLDEMKGVDYVRPHGAFYVFPKLDLDEMGVTCEEFSKHAIENYGVVTVPGSIFGKAGESFIRIAYSNSYEKIDKGLDRLENCIDSLLE